MIVDDNGNALPDHKLLDILLDSTLEHSDFTRESDTRRRRRILNAIEERCGIVTEEDFLRVFKSYEPLASYLRIYGLEPHRLRNFVAGILEGEITLTGGREQTSIPDRDLRHVDLLGIFTEFTERFGFSKKLVYEGLATHLKVPGYDKAERGYSHTDGAEKVRQKIAKLKKQLEQKRR